MPNQTGVPQGYHSVTPYLIVKDAAKAIDFYRRAFGAEERYRLEMPGGKIGHAEVRIGDSVIMLADEFPEAGARCPQTVGATPVSFCIYVPNVDQFFEKAVTEGAVVNRPVQDQFYGDRIGTLVDPFGHMWSIATRVEEVSPEEMKRRLAQPHPYPTNEDSTSL